MVATRSKPKSSKDVIVVGEYTTSSGPWADDYFLIVIRRSGRVSQFPVWKAHKVIRLLKQALGVEFKYELNSITEEASRVVYPMALEGRPLFNFTLRSDSFSGLSRLVRKLWIDWTDATLTREIESYVSSQKHD